MSRCFPFPPPGYERRHRPEDLDLLKEAKRKEKKHKKEKKYKEKKKDKENEKDGSDEKHKEKKDRKGKNKDKREKHRDKKDKEDRGKDEDKSSILEKSIVAEKFEDTSGETLQQRVHNKHRGSSLNEGKSSALFQGQNGGKPSQSSLSSQANEEMIARAAVRKSLGQLVEEKGDNKNKRIKRKVDPQGLRNEFSGNMLVQNLEPMTKSKVEGISKPVDEQGGRRLEEKEKYKEIGAIERWNKQKDKVKESQVNEKDNEKVEKKDEKVKKKTENKKSSQNQLKDDGRNDLGGFSGNRSTGLLKDTNSHPANEGSIKKRKDMCTNGFLRESEIRPNKLQRPDPHLWTENGRKPEPFQTPIESPHDKHAVPNNVLLDSKDMLMNGIIEAQKPSPLKPKPSAAIVVNNQTEASKIPHRDSICMNKVLKVPKIEDLIAEASRRPPHPDSEYLVKVLAVPKMNNWSENDDQEWLFCKRGPSNKPTMESNGVKDDLCVWSEAVYIESADICALPYVIPY